MSELKRCHFCGGEAIYETKRENEFGTIIPQLFCNCCKMIFEIENDSPYLNDDKTYDYLKEKLHNLWNTRKPIQNIVERLEEIAFADIDETYTDDAQQMLFLHDAIEIVTEMSL